MKKLLFTTVLLMSINVLNIYAQNNPPVAVPDTVTVMAENEIAINAIQNDYDLDGDYFYIYNVYQPIHGSRWHDDSIIYYRSYYYFGDDSVRYKLKDETGLRSDRATVLIHVLENPDLPYAVSDTFTVFSQKNTMLNVLSNDGDPNGDNLKIKTVYYNGYHGVYTISGDSVIYFKSNTDFTGPTTLSYNNIESNTTTEYFSNDADIVLNVIDNPDLPVAVDDDVDLTTFVPKEINILTNDYDPGNNTFKIFSIDTTNYTTPEIISDSIVRLTTTLFSGTDLVYYRIVEKDSPDNYISKRGCITIHAQPNPNIPVAVDDTITAVFAEKDSLNVLCNDYSPTGEPLEIKDAHFEGEIANGNTYFIYINDSLLGFKVIRPALSFEDSIHNMIIKYRIREKNNPSIYSDWGNILIKLKRNPNLPAGVNDYAKTKSGIPIQINLLKNDLNPQNDSVYILRCNLNEDHGMCVIINDSTVKYTSNNNFYGIDTVYYGITTNNFFETIPVSYGYLIVNVENHHFYDELNVNNIYAGINADGFLFNKYLSYGINSEVYCAYPRFEVPAGSKINAIFCNSLWIAALDNNNSDNNLHVAAVRYMQTGHDFWHGPVSDTYDSLYDNKWFGLWKLNKSDIVYHIKHYHDFGYIPVRAIAEWPGNGDVSNGQAEQLAPFYDKNNNGIYEPMEGDYPLIRGDQAVYFIYNDDRDFHGETKGKKLGVEIHGMAYAYNAPEDSSLWNTIFVHYDIYNRSDTTYDSAYLGEFVDTDLGYAWNDYVLCDVQRGSMITYNGTDMDFGGYGNNMPALAITILGGPYMENDNMDNPAGGCDESINGMNFGNGIVDDERLGMQYFMYFYNGGNPAQTDPYLAPDYYNYMHGTWKDHTHMIYGGAGYPVDWDTIGLGPDCNFMFPGNSDTCNWGTGGVFPNGGYNQNGFYWTEETANNGSPNQPSDRRGLLSTGPFTFEPGDKVELDVSYTFAICNNGGNPVNVVKDRVSDIRTKVETDSLLKLPEKISSVNEIYNPVKSINVFPNPSQNGMFYVDCRKVKGDIKYRIFAVSGKMIMQGNFTQGSINNITLATEQKGIYLLQILTPESNYYTKLVWQ